MEVGRGTIAQGIGAAVAGIVLSHLLTWGYNVSNAGCSQSLPLEPSPEMSCTDCLGVCNKQATITDIRHCVVSCKAVCTDCAATASPKVPTQHATADLKQSPPVSPGKSIPATSMAPVNPGSISRPTTGQLANSASTCWQERTDAQIPEPLQGDNQHFQGVQVDDAARQAQTACWQAVWCTGVSCSPENGGWSCTLRGGELLHKAPGLKTYVLAFCGAGADVAKSKFSVVTPNAPRPKVLVISDVLTQGWKRQMGYTGERMQWDCFRRAAETVDVDWVIMPNPHGMGEDQLKERLCAQSETWTLVLTMWYKIGPILRSECFTNGRYNKGIVWILDWYGMGPGEMTKMEIGGIPANRVLTFQPQHCFKSDGFNPTGGQPGGSSGLLAAPMCGNFFMGSCLSHVSSLFPEVRSSDSSSYENCYGVAWGKEVRYLQPKAAALEAISKICPLQGTLKHRVPGIPVEPKGNFGSRTGWLRWLRGAAFVIGCGDPLIGPTPLEAVMLGTTVLMPWLNEPRAINGASHFSQFDWLLEAATSKNSGYLVSLVCGYSSPSEAEHCARKALEDRMRQGQRPTEVVQIPGFTDGDFVINFGEILNRSRAAASR